MSLQVEKLEKSMAKLTIEVSANKLEEAIQKSYLKNKGKITVPGFRKGKVARQLIEKMYGAEIFYEDAANILISEAYEEEADNCELEIVSQPQIDVVQLEKGKPFIFTAEVAIRPEVILGKYKGVEIEKVDIDVTDEELIEEIDKVRTQNARMVTVDDRAVVDGDITVIDYEGFVDGVAFEGGKGENHTLEIGTHSFIDTFEEQIIGMKIDEEKDINVTFPEQYHSEDLAGKPATFKVKLHEIRYKELPELDDDFAGEVSEFDTLDEYKDDLRSTILEKKKSEAKNEKEDKIIDKIIEGTQVEIPEPMINNQTRQMAEEFAQNVSRQGLSLEQYFQFTGMDMDKFFESLKPQALKRIQIRLILEEIVKTEDIQISEEEVEEEIGKMAEAYKMEIAKLQEVISDKDKENIKMDKAIHKAIDMIVELAVEN